MKSKIWVELVFTGFDISHDELTTIVGVCPSYIVKKGDLLEIRKDRKIIEPFNEWIVESGCKTSEYLESQLRILISKLKPFSPKLLEFCSKCPPDFNILIHIFTRESYPYIGIDDPQIIKDMAQLNSTFGIDYSFFEDGDDI
jgi:oligoribonuclease (3'-5' exoribonuclease)